MFGILWNDLEFIEKFSKTIPFVSLLVAFLAGLLVQTGGFYVNRQLAILRLRAELVHKRTAPVFDVELAISDKKNLFVVVKPKNQVPFDLRWVLVTEENRVVSGLMLQDIKIHPKPTDVEKKWPYQFRQQMDESEVTNNYVELRVTYKSIYAAEVEAEGLHGKITKKYRMAKGALIRISDDIGANED